MYVYVMTQEGCDEMLRRGFKLIKKNESCNLWCFENNGTDMMTFDLSYPHIVSDILTF